MGNDLVDDAEFGGLFRRDDIGEKREFLGRVKPDQPWKDPGPAEIDGQPAAGEDR